MGIDAWGWDRPFWAMREEFARTGDASIVSRFHMDYMLDVRGVLKSFGGLSALHKVDMHVKAGEVVGLIGPNGSGKTTLFNVLSGFYAPDEGQILFEGRRLDRQAPHVIARRGR